MKPALTAEEWAAVQSDSVREIDGVLLSRERNAEPYICSFLDSHGMAAFHLHDQPFGFTREDVKMLREEAAWSPMSCADLADRIEALLPPDK